MAASEIATKNMSAEEFAAQPPAVRATMFAETLALQQYKTLDHDEADNLLQMAKACNPEGAARYGATRQVTLTASATVRMHSGMTVGMAHVAPLTLSSSGRDVPATFRIMAVTASAHNNYGAPVSFTIGHEAAAHTLKTGASASAGAKSIIWASRTMAQTAHSAADASSGVLHHAAGILVGPNASVKDETLTDANSAGPALTDEMTHMFYGAGMHMVNPATMTAVTGGGVAIHAPAEGKTPFDNPLTELFLSTCSPANTRITLSGDKLVFMPTNDEGMPEQTATGIRALGERDVLSSSGAHLLVNVVAPQEAMPLSHVRSTGWKAPSSASPLADVPNGMFTAHFKLLVDPVGGTPADEEVAAAQQ